MYLVGCQIIMGVAQFSKSSKCSMEINWLGLCLIWWNCSNLLSSWICSISDLMGTKFMLMFSGWFSKLVDFVIDVDALVLGRQFPWVVDHHGCHAKTTSSNNWTCSWLSSCWTLSIHNWVDVCGVVWWVVESMLKKPWPQKRRQARWACEDMHMLKVHPKGLVGSGGQHRKSWPCSRTIIV